MSLQSLHERASAEHAEGGRGGAATYYTVSQKRSHLLTVCNKRSPKNGSPCPIGPLSVCLSNVGVLWLNGGRIRKPLGMEVGLAVPGTRCVIWRSSCPLRKWAQQPTPLSQFTDAGFLRPYKPRPMSIVAKRLDRSGCHLQCMR